MQNNSRFCARSMIDGRRAHSEGVTLLFFGAAWRGDNTTKISKVKYFTIELLKTTRGRNQSFLPKTLEEAGQFFRAEIGQDSAIDFEDGCEFLAGEAEHFLEGSVVRDDIDLLVLDIVLIQPARGFMAPAAIGFDEKAGFHLRLTTINRPAFCRRRA